MSRKRRRRESETIAITKMDNDEVRSAVRRQLTGPELTAGRLGPSPTPDLMGSL
jgi:hypothetical protein